MLSPFSGLIDLWGIMPEYLQGKDLDLSIKSAIDIYDKQLQTQKQKIHYQPYCKPTQSLRNVPGYFVHMIIESFYHFRTSTLLIIFQERSSLGFTPSFSPFFLSFPLHFLLSFLLCVSVPLSPFYLFYMFIRIICIFIYIFLPHFNIF